MRGFAILPIAAMSLAALPGSASAAPNGGRSEVGFASVSAHPGRGAGVRVHRHHGERGHFGRRAHDYGGDAYFPYREYQGDTLWRSGGFNDWWHDRPDRAFPRWVRNNRNCERQWWAGGGWRC